LLSRAESSKEFKFKLVAPVSALVLWTLLWCNLNTGFWNIKPPSDFNDWLLAIRGFLPFLVFPAAGFLLLIRRKLILKWYGPSRLLMAYGFIAALASIFNPEPLWSLYWSILFLATMFAAWNFLDRTDPLGAARQMLQVTWVATFVVAAIIGYQAQGSIFGHAHSGYAVVSELQGLSRSSGVARWAAVPGLVCLVRAYHSRRIVFIPFYLAIAGIAFYIVYRMQSRGAVFGSVAALAFAFLVGSRLRRYALPFAILATVVILILETPAVMSNQIDEYLRRGQSEEDFHSMTGRTRTYAKGVAAFEDAPLFGRGQWADRTVIYEHVHNSYLQALMNAGIIGGIPYFASWGAGWILFFKLQKRRARLSEEDQLCLLEAGTVMMFFTVRAIPETTTASFAVDLLVMVAVYVYLEALAIVAARRQSRQPAKMPFHAPLPIHPPRLRQAS
jgi:O-antigen ligase